VTIPLAANLSRAALGAVHKLPAAEEVWSGLLPRIGWGVPSGLMHDLTSTAQLLCQYTSGVMLLALTFRSWQLERRGKSTETLRVSYFVLACLLLLFMALPLAGVDKVPSYYSF
jgi:hypothetical protein